ncbi:MAG TPA: DUF302 domain-containing protein [Steroidobacteraceae bacterium]|nr:DUF302 domain-containing protein [Steroidobacteraceae bacterium]
MSYYLSRIIPLAFEDAVMRVKGSLAREGFGVLSDIDVQATLKGKLGVEFPAYRILGACNPAFAHKALLMEDKLGVLLPCNVIVRQSAPGQVEIAAVDPVASLERTGNTGLAAVAAEVRDRLQRAVDAV